MAGGQMLAPSNLSCARRILWPTPGPTRYWAVGLRRALLTTNAARCHGSTLLWGGRIGVKILVTGGAGFIGSNFVRYLLHTRHDVELFNFDKLTYAGNIENLMELDRDPRYHFVRGDIADQPVVDEIFQHGVQR